RVDLVDEHHQAALGLRRSAFGIWDARYWILDAGYLMLAVGTCIQYLASSILHLASCISSTERRRPNAAQRDMAHGLEEALHRPEVRVWLPEAVEGAFEAKLLSEQQEEALVPLLRSQVLAEAGEVEDGHAAAAGRAGVLLRDLLQPGSGAKHEG